MKNCKHCQKAMVRKFRHRLMCGDSTKAADVAKLMDGQQADLLVTDPPYNVAYVGGTGMTIQNDSMDDDAFLKFLTDAFTNAYNHQRPGGAFYIFHADSYGYHFRKATVDAGYMLKQVVQWVKNNFVMGRQDYQWSHEPCQPAGTMVRTPDGEVPIEQLKDGDRVLSYDQYQGTIAGKREGCPVKVAVRNYQGNLYGVKVGSLQTWATDTHQFSVRYSVRAARRWCVYLMRRGTWWRIGIARAYDARGFCLKNRFKTEKADAAWILDVFETRLEAIAMEQALSVRYGIPETHWNIDRGIDPEDKDSRSAALVDRIYAEQDLDRMVSRAGDLLRRFGRRIDLPFIHAGNIGQKCSRRVTVQVPACNVVAGLMEVPVPTLYADWNVKGSFLWLGVDGVERKEHDGPVYSLDVEKYEHYIADGIVTHNCLYGWKDGAAHSWYSDRKQTTVWNFDRPRKSSLHPTMKPILLIEYPIQNSSKENDLVLDLFGGSGSTMIAAEKNKRRSALMELDPKYAQAILNRFRDYTGGRTVEKLGEASPE